MCAIFLVGWQFGSGLAPTRKAVAMSVASEPARLTGRI